MQIEHLVIQNKMENSQQQAYMELELVNQQLSQIEQSMNITEDQILQLENAKNSLEGLKQGSEEIFFPLSPGISVSVGKVDLEKIKVAVGSQIIVDKSFEDTLKVIETHLIKFKEHKQKLIDIFDKISLKAIKLQSEIEKNQQV
jgi:prefoldin subunit 5